MDQETALRAAFDLRTQFERVWPWLAASISRYSHTHDKEDLWRAIEKGTAQLWPLKRAALVTTIDTFPTGLKQINGWLAGGDLAEIVAYVPIIEEWAKIDGCTEISIVGRRGWLKAFKDYEEAGTIMKKAI